MRVYVEIRCPNKNTVLCRCRHVRFATDGSMYVRVGRRLIFLDDPPGGVYWRPLNFVYKVKDA